jgi:hypothetical protein
LKEKGYRVLDTTSGSGVPKLSRLEIDNDKERLACAVKITTTSHGRISFTRNDDGTYKVLSGSDRVIYARPVDDDGSRLLVMMYDGETIRRAFDENFRARQGTDQENLPMWLSPDQEPGTRFIGSGFGREALWSETTPLEKPNGGAAAAAHPTSSLPAEEGQPAPAGIMEQVKTMLSAHMGVRPDQVEIDVRVKV